MVPLGTALQATRDGRLKNDPITLSSDERIEWVHTPGALTSNRSKNYLCNYMHWYYIHVYHG